MSLLTAEEVTNLYLYGTKNLPANIENEALIRSDSLSKPTSVKVDINEYMTSGPGRFASPAFFDVVEQFFAPLDGTLLQLAFPASFNLAPGIYSKYDLFAAFGISKAWVGIQQSLYDDGQDNYLERAYIWESTAFQIDSRAKFVVEANGNRYIQDFAIIPYSVNGNTEDFDFKSDSGFSGLVNFALEPLVDPSGIGRTVVISFDRTRNVDAMFTHAEYINAASTAVLPNPGLVGTIIANALSFTDQLFESGSIRFLDANNKPILYGSDEDDVIFGTLSRTHVDIADVLHPLRGWVENGIRYIGGAGDDKLVGTDYDDKLFGGDDNDFLDGLSGNDTLEGGKGNDRLLGEDGNDTYIYNQGDGFDTIIDSNGSIIEDDVTLTGGKEVGGNRVYQSIDKKHSYVFVTGNKDTGGDLLIDSTILIKHFNNNDLNLSFTAATPEKTPETSREINGDLSPLDTDPTQDGVQIGHDDLDNVLTGEADPDRNDTLNDSAGNDAINSGGGKDIIIATHGGDDLIDAGAGQDKVYESNSLAGNDVISGGADNDILAGGLGDDRIYADHPIGVAEAIANGNNQTGTGSKGDWLAGQSGDDTLVSGADNDVLSGGGGNDLLIGGAGNDDIMGDASLVAQDFTWTATWENKTRIFKPAIGDLTPIDAGADIVYAGKGNDIVLAGAGNDIVFGEDGDDYLQGDEGNDILLGGAGSDTQVGMDGDDILAGGANVDSLDGGAGRDTYIFNKGDGHDTVFDPDKDSTVIFGEGITQDDITLKLGSLLLDLGNGDEIHIDGFDQTDVFNSSSVSSFSFADGSALSLNQLLARGFDLNGTNQNDTIAGTNTIDRIKGLDGIDLLAGLAGNDSLEGGAGNDELQGGEGDDRLDGGADDDLLFGEAGDDLLLGDAGIDRLQGGTGNDTLDGGASNDLLFGESGDDHLLGNDGNDELQGNQGDDHLDGGTGDDRLFGQDGDDSLVSGDGEDTLLGGIGLDTLLGGSGLDTLQGGADSDLLDGGADDDLLFGEAGLDTLIGGEGDDFLIGGAGNDVLKGGSGIDTYIINLGDGIDSIEDTYESDSLEAGVAIGFGNILQFGPGITSSMIKLNLGSLLINLNNNGDAVHIEGFNPDDPYTNPVISRFEFADGTVLSYQQLLSRGFDLTGTPNTDVINGTGTDDRINALASDDVVYGKNGNDTLNGGSGADTLLGGNGDDVYNVDDIGDVLVEDSSAGQDRVMSSITYTLPDNIEDLSLADGVALTGTGNGLNNELTGNNGDNQLVGLEGNDTLIGNAGNDTLDGGSGGDALVGGDGDDHYVVDDSNDTLTEYAHAGQDQVESSVTFTLAANIEDLNLLGDIALDGTGNALNNNLTGNNGDNQLTGLDGNDVLTGNIGNDVLEGGSGADTLLGGNGDDSYSVDDVGDVVTENTDDGIDTVYSSVSYKLGANLESLTLFDGLMIDGYGNELANRITGNELANWLDGLGGADSLIGGFGDDSYRVDNIDDLVIEAGYEGYDSIETTVSYTLADNIERLVLSGTDALNGTGNALDNVLYGNTGDNTLTGLDGTDQIFGGEGNDRLDGGNGNDALDGGISVDTMLGGLGDDVYQVNNSNDASIEEADAGYDSVYAQADYILGSHIEDLYLTGWQAINGTGNDLDNKLIGNMANNLLQGLAGNDQLVDDWGNDTLQGGAGNDSLDGGYGTDFMQGGSGDDSYVVDTSADTVFENLDEGNDTVQATATYILPDHVENLQLLGDFTQQSYIYPLDGTGNALDNKIDGNDGVNILTGLDGQDTIDGRGGDDSLNGDAGNDTLYGGGDAIYLYIDEGGYEIPQLTANADVINGQDGNDSIDGGSGDDQLYGSDGDDVLYGGNDGLGVDIPMYESYIFLTNNDILDSGTGQDLMDGGSGNDTLYGGDGEDNIYGGDDGSLNISNNDFLDGGTGIDTMRGGSGDDIYIVDGTTQLLIVQGFDECHIGSGDDDAGPSLASTSDLVIENSNEGYDLIYSSVSLTLPDNVEEVDFTGTANIDVVGNADFNLILGNAGNNRIDGGLGDDTMTGSLGDDVYFLDSLGDTIVEQADEGTDTVRSFVDAYALGANLENLDLVGTAVTGYGNALNNLIRGNMQANLIDAGDGNDFISGAGGDDTLNGGMGDDSYVFSIGFGNDVAMDTGGNNDEVRMNDDLTLNDITLTRQGDDVILGLKNSQDQLVLSLWFNPEQRIESIRFCDGTIVDSATIERTVNNQAPVAADDVATVREDISVNVTGNVLSNDSDPDSGDSLSVINSGLYAGIYGTGILAGNGDFTYTLNNNMTEIQSLGEGQHLSETWTYDIQDNDPVRPLTSSAAITVIIAGSNDAPTLALPVIDQTGRIGEPISYKLADNTFTDIDQGDVLTLSAQLLNGDPLPAWLSFDAINGLLSGTPIVAGDVQIQITATDTGGLSASDLLTLAIAEQKTASLSGFVYLDTDNNGIKNALETGLAGVAITLTGTDSLGSSVALSTLTNADGSYLFDQLGAGTYQLNETQPAYQDGKDSAGSLGGIVTNDQISAITLKAGENGINNNFGELLTSSSTCSTFNFKGNSATDGTDGNIRRYTVDDISVNASAFSRNKTTGDWNKAWLGSYSGGLGVTDSSEGSGSGNTHTVDNTGRDNYVLFEFSTSVVVDKAYLGYVLNDSDIKVWIGTFNSPFSHHLKLSDSVLNNFGFTELNQTTLSSARWADLNEQGILGNTLIIAADTTNKTPEDNFKIQQLKVCVPDTEAEKPCDFGSKDAPGVGTHGFWKQWTVIWDGDNSNDYQCNNKANFAKTDILYTVTDPVTGTNADQGILVGDWNGNGITDHSERTLFYSLAEAKTMLSASDSGQDCRYLMGKQLVAAWLNVIAGNNADKIETDINNAIEWLQNHTPNEGGSRYGDGNLTINTPAFKIPSSDQDWQVIANSDPAHSGSYCGVAIKNVLDYYNNTGAGFAIDRDSDDIQGSLVALLGLQAYQQEFHG